MYANFWCCGFWFVCFCFFFCYCAVSYRVSGFLFFISILLIVKVAIATIFLFEHLFGFAVCLGGKYTTAANDVIGNNSLATTFARSTCQPIDRPTECKCFYFLLSI